MKLEQQVVSLELAKKLKEFGFSLTNDIRRPEIYLISGYPVYERDYIPKGEMWMCNKDGKVMRIAI